MSDTFAVNSLFSFHYPTNFLPHKQVKHQLIMQNTHNYLHPTLKEGTFVSKKFFFSK